MIKKLLLGGTVWFLVILWIFWYPLSVTFSSNNIFLYILIYYFIFWAVILTIMLILKIGENKPILEKIFGALPMIIFWTIIIWLYYEKYLS